MCALLFGIEAQIKWQRLSKGKLQTPGICSFICIEFTQHSMLPNGRDGKRSNKFSSAYFICKCINCLQKNRAFLFWICNQWWSNFYWYACMTSTPNKSAQFARHAWRHLRCICVERELWTPLSIFHSSLEWIVHKIRPANVMVYTIKKDFCLIRFEFDRSMKPLLAHRFLKKSFIYYFRLC